MGSVRKLLDILRNPMYNWNESYTKSFIPEEGTIIKISKRVEDEYTVVYLRDEGGDVVGWKHIRIKPEEEISYGGTD